MTRDGDLIRSLIPGLPSTDPWGWLAARAAEADQIASPDETENTKTGCTCGQKDHL